MAEVRGSANDFIQHSGWRAFFWWLPILAIFLVSVLGSQYGVSWPVAGVVLGMSFTLMGAGCTINAARCGRTHCAFTGPLFLLLGLASFLNGFHVVEIGWNPILYTALIGGVLLTVLPDRLLGRYRWKG